MTTRRAFLLQSTVLPRPARYGPAVCGPLLVCDVIECIVDPDYMLGRLNLLAPWAAREFEGEIARQLTAPGRREGASP